MALDIAAGYASQNQFVNHHDVSKLSRFVTMSKQPRIEAHARAASVINCHIRMKAASCILFLAMLARPSIADSVTKEAEQALAAANSAVEAAKRAEAIAEKDWKETQLEGKKSRYSYNTAEAEADANKKASSAVEAAREAIEKIPPGTNTKKKDKLQKELKRLIAVEAVRAAQAAVRRLPNVRDWMLFWGRSEEDIAKREKGLKEEAEDTINSAETAINELDPKERGKLAQELEEVKERLKQLSMGGVQPGCYEGLATLMDSGEVKVSNVGTGETLGNVANFVIVNCSDRTLKIAIPPMILKSKSEQCQDYSIPEPRGATIEPGETESVPLTGICITARKPPVGRDRINELAIFNANNSIHGTTGTRILMGTLAVKDMVSSLQNQGKFNTPYQDDPKKERDIIMQWTTWMFVSAFEGNSVTQADLAKKVFEQLPEDLTPAQREEILSGIKGIWAAVEIVGIYAKVTKVPQGLTTAAKSPKTNEDAQSGKERTNDIYTVMLATNEWVAAKGQTSIEEVSEEDIKYEADGMQKNTRLPWCRWDTWGWMDYDSRFGCDRFKRIRVRGLVMDRGEFNYYYIGMGCKLKGMTWEECRDMIEDYKWWQRTLHIGSGKVTSNLILAAGWGYDETKRPETPPASAGPSLYEPPREQMPAGYTDHGEYIEGPDGQKNFR